MADELVERIKVKPGMVLHGSVYPGPSPLQDERYGAMVAANVKARAEKRKQEREAAA